METRELPVHLTECELVEVQQRYIAAVDEKERYLEGWEQTRAAHKEALAGHNKELGKLLGIMRNGVEVRPVSVQVYTYEQTETYEVIRADTGEVVAQGPLGELVLSEDESLPGLAGNIVPLKADEAQVEEVAEAEGENPRAGILTSGDIEEALGEGKSADVLRALVLGPVDATEMKKSTRTGNWSCTAGAVLVLVDEHGMTQERAAYSMGAHARAAGKKGSRNPFDTGNTDEVQNWTAWNIGWRAMEALEVDQAEQAAADASAKEVGRRPVKLFLKRVAELLPAPEVVRTLTEKEGDLNWCISADDLSADAQAEARGALARLLGYGQYQGEYKGKRDKAWHRGYEAMDALFDGLSGENVEPHWRQDYRREALAMVKGWCGEVQS